MRLSPRGIVKDQKPTLIHRGQGTRENSSVRYVRDRITPCGGSKEMLLDAES